MDSSALESIALYAAMAMPSLLLQSPHRKLRQGDLVKHLDRRLSLWSIGDLNSLLAEGCAIQNHLPCRSACNKQYSDQLGRKFSNFMMSGKVRAALRLLSDKDCSVGVLSLNSVIDCRSVKDILLDKHPSGQPTAPSTIVSSPQHSDFHPIVFDALTPELIRATALRSEGSPGASGFTHGVNCNALLLISYRCPNLNCSQSSMSLVRLPSLEVVRRYGYYFVFGML